MTAILALMLAISGAQASDRFNQMVTQMEGYWVGGGQRTLTGYDGVVKRWHVKAKVTSERDGELLKTHYFYEETPIDENGDPTTDEPKISTRETWLRVATDGSVELGVPGSDQVTSRGQYDGTFLELRFLTRDGSAFESVSRSHFFRKGRVDFEENSHLGDQYRWHTRIRYVRMKSFLK
jgi:hypothetical protein